MTDIERVEQAEPSLNLAVIIDQVDEAGSLHLRGYRNSEIAELLQITPVMAKKYVQEYLYIIQHQVENDPNFLDRVGLNTMKTIKELEDIQKEAWETVTVATDNAMIGQRVAALKLALDVSTKKAQLMQLMNAGSRDNSDSYARTQKAENVNQILSRIIRDIVGDCDKCRERARDLLAQAFSLMEVDDAEVVPDDED